MRHLVFNVHCKFQCEDGSKFRWVFSEGSYVFADSPHTVLDGRNLYYTPESVIERVVRLFFSGLTERERKQACKTLEIEAWQALESGAL
jgi:hypothetical protein